jgi:hypothetical protein
MSLKPRRSFLNILGIYNAAFSVFAFAIDLVFILLSLGVGTWEDWFVSVSLFIAAAMLTIPAGLLITPQTSRESQLFSSLASAIAAFISGWLLSKIDGIASQVLSYDALDDLAILRICGCVSIFVVSTAAIYALRNYADWSAINARFQGRKKDGAETGAPHFAELRGRKLQILQSPSSPIVASDETLVIVVDANYAVTDLKVGTLS